MQESWKSGEDPAAYTLRAPKHLRVRGAGRRESREPVEAGRAAAKDGLGAAGARARYLGAAVQRGLPEGAAAQDADGDVVQLLLLRRAAAGSRPRSGAGPRARVPATAGLAPKVRVDGIAVSLILAQYRHGGGCGTRLRVPRALAALPLSRFRRRPAAPSAPPTREAPWWLLPPDPEAVLDASGPAGPPSPLSWPTRSVSGPWIVGLPGAVKVRPRAEVWGARGGDRGALGLREAQECARRVCRTPPSCLLADFWPSSQF